MNKRYPEVDVLKALGILVVILIHCLRPWWIRGVSPAEIWLGQITRFAVPGFLAASGFLYATSASLAWGTTFRRLRRVLIPYLIASTAAQVFLAMRGSSGESGSILGDYLFGASFGPYYFIFVFTLLVLATPAFARLPRKAVIGLLVAFLLAQGGTVVSKALFEGARATVFSTFWLIRNPMLWWGYFLLGWLVRLHYDALAERLCARRWWIAAAFAVAVAGFTAITSFELPRQPGLQRVVFDLAGWFDVFAILGLIFALSCGRRQLPAPVRFLSEATFTIYLVHLFFLFAAQDHFPHVRWVLDPLALLVPWTAALLGSLLVIAVGRTLLRGHSRDVIGT